MMDPTYRIANETKNVAASESLYSCGKSQMRDTYIPTYIHKISTDCDECKPT